MTKKAQDIHTIVSILKKEVKNLKEPAVTLVGKKWKTPFRVLVSCILSLRTQDKTTWEASNRLFSMASTPYDMVQLTQRQIEKAIYPVGFYRTKSRVIRQISKELIEKYKGEVPSEINTLLTLPGVGRKTANLIVTEGFGKLGICVDTHVHRISNRLGYVRTKTPEETEWALRKKLPKQYWKTYNSLLVVWGQNICKPISPYCSKCHIQSFCAKCDVTKSR